MQELEQRLQQRFPDWFHGRRGQLARPLLRSVGRWSRLDQIEAFLQRSAGLRGFGFVAAGLEFIDGQYQVDPAALAKIPATGRLLIVANHPSGALDALALLDAVGRIRRDVRIVANDLLGAIAPLQDLLLPVRILGGKAQRGSLHAVEEALAAEQCVIVFPAGEVSRLSLRGIRDGRWQRGFVRFARAAGAPVLPVRVEARNSALFYGASTLFKPAGTALLAREMFTRRGRPLRLSIGEPMQLGKGGDPGAQLLAVRRALYALGRNGAAGNAAAFAGPEPLAAPVPPSQVAAGIAAATQLGQTADGKQILLATCTADSPLLLELGRLRELTFRQVGEGTGRSRDLDDYDPQYEHIVIWDAAAQRIAGAYRIMRGAHALARHGLSGLYSASLFRYSDDAITHIAEGLELGRSFVVPDYWGSRSLDYLWQASVPTCSAGRVSATCSAPCRSARCCHAMRASSWWRTTSAITAVPPAWPNRTARSSTSPRRRVLASWMQAPRSMCSRPTWPHSAPACRRCIASTQICANPVARASSPSVSTRTSAIRSTA